MKAINWIIVSCRLVVFSLIFLAAVVMSFNADTSDFKNDAKKSETVIKKYEDVFKHPSYFKITADSVPDKVVKLSSRQTMDLVRKYKSKFSEMLNEYTSTTLEVKTHKVKKGENLASIANYYEIPVENILTKNSLDSDSIIRPGQEIRITKRIYKEFAGFASCYGGGDGFHGKPTSNGEVYDKNAMTAATLPLPEGLYIKVINLRTGKSVVLRTNDKGPFVVNEDGEYARIADLSEAAMRSIGGLEEGVIPIRIKVVDYVKSAIDIKMEQMVVRK